MKREPLTSHGKPLSVQNIHGQVAKRLFFAWLVISISIGAVTAYLEVRNVDELASSIALSASDSLQIHATKHGVQHIDALNTALTALLEHGYVQAQVFNESGQEIAKVHADNQESLLTRLTSMQHNSDSIATASIMNKTMWLSGDLIVQVYVPLRDASGSRIAYFTGVYKLDKSALKHAREDLYRTVFLVLLAVLVTSALLYPLIIGLHRGVLRLSNDLMHSNIELMEVLGSAIAKRDSDTDIHNYRVCLYSISFAEALSLSRDKICAIIIGAFLHDVGKIGISDTILLKKGKLTEAEFAVMKTHVQLGVDIVNKATWIDSARDIIEFHHEKFDGSGYLCGLSGDSIPLTARLFAIVDVFDALTSRRPYKDAFAVEDAVRILVESGGSHFDPRLVDTFTEIAYTLHECHANASASDLQALLRKQIEKYFF